MAHAAKRVLLTGGNRGIGFATAVALVRAGHAVTITVRDPRLGAEAASRIAAEVPGARVDVVALDLASFAAVRRCADELGARAEPYDVLVHNAGVLVAAKERRLTVDGLEECLQVHAVAPLLLTQRLAARGLAPACRIVALASGLHAPRTHGAEVAFDFDDPSLARNYHWERAYKNSKLAQLWFVLEWERRFGASGRHADAICPGFVPSTGVPRTSGWTRFQLRFILPLLPFTTTVERAAATVARFAESAPDAPGGRYFDGKRLAPPSDDARDPAKAAAFWALAERWIAE